MGTRRRRETAPTRTVYEIVLRGEGLMRVAREPDGTIEIEAMNGPDGNDFPAAPQDRIGKATIRLLEGEFAALCDLGLLLFSPRRSPRKAKVNEVTAPGDGVQPAAPTS